VTKLYRLVYFFLVRQPHGVECQSLCSSEVTRKLQLEVEEGAVDTYPSAS